MKPDEDKKEEKKSDSDPDSTPTVKTKPVKPGQADEIVDKPKPGTLHNASDFGPVLSGNDSKEGAKG